MNTNNIAIYIQYYYQFQIINVVRMIVLYYLLLLTATMIIVHIYIIM